MKTMQKFIVALLLVAAGTAQAQVTVNVNIGKAPDWGPAGYTEVRYYYMPAIEVYYDINTANYIYASNGAWVRATVLPATYKNVNLYTTYKVVLTDYKGATPYVYYKKHKVKYPKNYNPGHQKTIGTPPGHAKKAVAKAPGNGGKSAKKSNGNGNGKGHGNGKH